jgi:hypothetical protein
MVQKRKQKALAWEEVASWRDRGWAGEYRDFFAGLLSLLGGTAVV